MQTASPRGFQSSINVTPLVDVVLVLLIIFMVVAPRLGEDAALELPATERPDARSEGGGELIVSIERGGTLWLEGKKVSAQRLPEALDEAARLDALRPVLIKGDAGLRFGEVRQAMLAVEAAGFDRVALITRPLEPAGEED